MKESAMLAFALMVAVLLGNATASGSEVSAYFRGDVKSQILQKESAIQMPCAQGWFEDAMDKVGWNLLSVVTSPDCSDEDQAYSAGYVEGSLTSVAMLRQYRNEFHGFKASESLKSYLEENDAFVSTRVAEVKAAGAGVRISEDEQSYWWQVGLIRQQLHGLQDGYNAAMPAEQQLTALDFAIMSLHGDLEDLEDILQASAWDSQRLRFQSQFQPQPAADSHLQQPASSQEAQGEPSVEEVEEETVDGGQARRELQQQEKGDRARVSAGRLKDGLKGESCSAIVKLLPGNTDILTSHSTWTGFETMLRVYKLYDFHFHTGPHSSTVIPGRVMTFSGYPGRLFSGDDFYITSAGLVIQETTISNDNFELYHRYVHPTGTVLEWVRNMVANRLSNTGEQWTAVFSKFNSGTYNNQWMVVDHKLFTPGQPLKENTFWVLEQLPGYIEREDKSAHLESERYWASYNVPAFPSIFNLSGLPAKVEKYGPWFSFHDCPRAKMFRRDQGKVLDLAGMQRLIRYNDYKHDPLSACNCTPPYSAENAIAARGDLNLPNGTYDIPNLKLRDHGETDAKITSYSLCTSGLSSLAISGPTYDQQPPFRWSTSPFKDIPHEGHPDIFKFPWLTIQAIAGRNGDSAKPITWKTL